MHDVIEGSEVRLQSDQPLPNLTKGTGEVQELIAQQQANGLLGGLRKCAEKGEDGYFTRMEDWCIVKCLMWGRNGSEWLYHLTGDSRS